MIVLSDLCDAGNVTFPSILVNATRFKHQLHMSRMAHTERPQGERGASQDMSNTPGETGGCESVSEMNENMKKMKPVI